MALEVQIGADKSEFDKKIKEVENSLDKLDSKKPIEIKPQIDTSGISESLISAGKASVSMSDKIDKASVSLVNIGKSSSPASNNIESIGKKAVVASNDIGRIGKSATQVASELVPATNKIEKSLKEVSDSSKKTSSSFSDMNPKVANGSNALMQFSRIAQDAPFGIMGIGNNITATAEAFSHLSQSSGGAGGALKAVASSLMGTGGILLAVSLVTTGLTIMSQQGLTIQDVYKKLSGTFDETANSLSKIGIEAAKTAGTEIASINGLVSAAKNELLTRDQRLLAVKKLQDEYPAHFGNLTKERILNGDVALAVNEVSKALTARARASAIASKLGELAGKRLDLEEKRNIASAKFAEAKKRSEEDGSVFAAGLVFNLKAAADEYKNIQAQIKVLDQSSKTYSERENQEIAKSINLLKEKDKVVKKAKAPNITPQVTGLNSNLSASGLENTYGMLLKTAKGVQIAEGLITTSMGNIRTSFDSSTLSMLENLKAFNDSANELITSSIADTFSNLGGAIGEALATGGNVLSSIGNTILAGLGKFLGQMGGLLIKYGTLAIVKGKLDLAIATGGPVAIGAGIAAIAVGVALAAAGAAIGSAANSGGKATSGGNTGNSYSSPASNSSFSSGGSSGGGTVVFEISGQSLIGVLSNALDKNKRLGGNLVIG